MSLIQQTLEARSRQPGTSLPCICSSPARNLSYDSAKVTPRINIQQPIFGILFLAQCKAFAINGSSGSKKAELEQVVNVISKARLQKYTRIGGCGTAWQVSYLASQISGLVNRIRCREFHLFLQYGIRSCPIPDLLEEGYRNAHFDLCT